MNNRELREKYKELRIKYFNDSNYKNIQNLTKIGWTVTDLGGLYEFNFLSLLLYGCWDSDPLDTTKDMCAVIKNYQDHPQINWQAYVNYIDEVQTTLPLQDAYEAEIHRAVDEIRSKIGTPQNNQQLWL